MSNDQELGSTGPPAGLTTQREALHEAMIALEHAAAAAGPKRAAEWAMEIEDRLENLDAAFRVHLEFTEGPDGLYADITATAPRLIHAVDVLRAEHVQLAQMIEANLAAIGSGPPADAETWVRDRRIDVIALVAKLAHHRPRGADLTYEAYTSDLGGTG